MAWIFVAIAAAQTVAAVGSFTAPEMASAQGTFDAQVPIPGADISFDQTTRPLANYIKAVYTYAVGAVGILAAVMLMIGGLRWILAGGNAGSISEAKEIIFASITGMVLVMTSFIVLNEVNPALTSMRITQIKPISGVNEAASSPVKSSLCTWMMGQDGDDYKPGCPPKMKNGSPMGGDSFKEYTVSGQSANCGANTLDAEGKTSSCCCKPIPEGCPNDYGLNCQACDGCQSLTVPCKSNNSCKLAPGIASKLSNIYEDHKGWRITEAWPPTYAHKSSCHTKGLCADINLDDQGVQPERIKTLAEKLVAGGLTSFQYECTESPSCCSNYDAVTRCTYNSAASGNHFHVNQ